MTDQVLQLCISLVDSDPLIWRRFLVSDRTSLPDLHRVIQVIMGWENIHPYSFQIAGAHYDGPQPKDDPQALDHASIPYLAQFPLQPGTCLTYTYDPRDGWRHRIEVEASLSPIAAPTLPTCLGGERACPPENCGGVWGYEGLLERLEDPDDPDYDRLMEELYDFDPEAFSLETVNQRLQTLTLP